MLPSSSQVGFLEIMEEKNQLNSREDGLGRIQIATDEEIINLITPFSAELHKIVNRMISN